MDMVRFFAGAFFVIWSIIGVVVLIGSIFVIGFAAYASSLLKNVPLESAVQGLSGQRMEGMPNSQQIECVTNLLGKERTQEILRTRSTTAEEDELLKQCK